MSSLELLASVILQSGLDDTLTTLRILNKNIDSVTPLAEVNIDGQSEIMILVNLTKDDPKYVGATALLLKIQVSSPTDCSSPQFFNAALLLMRHLSISKVISTLEKQGESLNFIISCAYHVCRKLAEMAFLSGQSKAILADMICMCNTLSRSPNSLSAIQSILMQVDV